MPYKTKQAKLFEQGLRQCNLCKEVLPLDAFGPGNSPQGLEYRCLGCHANYESEYFQKLEQRSKKRETLFWSRVDKNGPVSYDGTQCWVYTARLSPDGYGYFSKERAHRYSWVLHKGPTNNLWVLHHCDNRACVRPEHLYLGTAKDNARDTRERGRYHEQNVTVCPKGHEYTGDNVQFYLTRTGKLWRKCRQCQGSGRYTTPELKQRRREYQKLWRQRKKDNDNN